MMTRSFVFVSVACLAVLACWGCQPAGYVISTDTTTEADWPAAEAAMISNVRQLTDQEMGLTKGGEAYFSPDLGMIIFQAWPAGESEYQMYTLEINPDGTARRDALRLVSPGGGACTCGFFKPDGSGILYGSTYLNPDMPNPAASAYDRKGGRYVWKMPGGMDLIEAGIDGSDPRQLTNVPGYDAECAYSPSGQSIVFSSDRDGDPDLYIINADGSEVRQLTDKAGYDGGPFFSPGGQRIIFRSDRNLDDHLQLFVINTDGTGERQLTQHGSVVNWAPFWHPNGSSIVYTTSIHGHFNYEVYLLNIDTGKHQRVTHSPRFDGLPVFSPNGKWMMWTSQRGSSGMSQVFMADFHLPGGF